MWISILTYTILVVVLVLFWILYRGTLSLQLLLTGIAIPLILYVILRIQRKCLHVQIRRNVSEVSKGEPFQWILQIRNSCLFTIPNALIVLEYRSRTEDIPRRTTLRIPLLGMNTQRVLLNFHANNCGVMEIRLISMRIYDSLRLFSLNVPSRCSNKLLVMPEYAEDKISDWTPPDENAEDATEYSKTKAGDDPSEVFEIHPYRSGDAVSRIHWKLSSKLDELMVKAYSLPIHTDILLLPDYRRVYDVSDSAERIDTVLSVLYAISNRFRNEGRGHSILWYNAASQVYSSCSLTESDDLEQLMREMMENVPTDSHLDFVPDTLREDIPCSELILITPKLDAMTLHLLPALAERRQLTVFYAIAEGESDEPPEAAAGFDCIPIRIPKAALKEAKVKLEEGDELLCEAHL